MFLRFYRMVAASIALLIFGTIAATSAWAIDVTVTNTQDAVENGTAGIFTFSTDSNVDNDTIINFTITGTAEDEVGETDYTTIDSFVTILDGDNSTTLTIATIDDNTSELDESVILTLTSTDNPSVDIGTPNTATITITDDDTPTVSIQAGNDITEGITVPAGQFRFISTNDVDGGLVITYELSGTATYGSDYNTPAGVTTNTITIAEGDADLSESVTLNLLEDSLAEGLETITATITSLSVAGGVIDPDNTTASIALTSDDTVDATIVSGASGTEDGTDATFIISLSSTATVPITIEYLDNASVADNGTDYTNLSGSLTIPAGSVSSQLNIAITDDGLNDAGETIVIDLDRVSAGPAVIGSPSSASSVIVDNDQALVSVAAGLSGSEAAADNVTFTIQLDQTATAGIAVNYTALGTASSLDYTAPSGTVNFAVGEQTKTVTFPILDDNLSEGTETVILRIDNATGPAAIGSPSSATRLISDDDTATLTIDQNPAAGVEEPDTNTTFTVRTDTASASDITVTYSTGGTATSNDDYAALSGQVTITAGLMTQDVILDVLNDNFAEDNETVIIALASVTSGSAVLGGNSSVTMIIEDNDTAQASLGSTTNTSEDNSSVNGNFIVRLDSAAQADITVQYSLSGDADNSSDYAALSGEVTIASGATTSNVVIDPIDDNDVEGNETVTLTLVGITSGPGRISGTPSASLTIADNDNASISIAAGDNGAEGGASGTFIVSSNSNSPSGYDISYSISGTVSASDYTDSGGGSVSIAAGSDNATITIPISDDSIIEDNETLTVTLTAVTSGSAGISANDNATITVTSEDVGTATIVHDNASEEAGLVDGTLVVSLDNSAVVPITFGYTVTGTATSGTDYTALPGSVTFPVGSTEQVITVDVLDDAAYEDNETVIVTLSSITSGPGAIGSPDNASHIITSDDNVSLSIVKVGDASEPSTNGTFRVSIPEAVDQDISFEFFVTGASTAGGSDYSITASPLTISSGDDNVTITVTPASDLLTESDETVIVQIDNITAGPANISATDTATMYIFDNNTQTVTLTSPDNGSEAGPDNASVTVSLASNATADVVVAYSVSGTATSGLDFTALSGSVTIDNGTSSSIITVPVLDDGLDEDNETVIITLSSVTSGPARITSSDNSSTLYIDDNDTSSVGLSVAATTEEGSTASFTVTLSAASGSDTTVNYSDNGSATSGTDYTAPSGSLVIPAGETSGVIGIPILADTVDDDNETLTVTINSITGTMTLSGTPTATTTITNVVDYEALINAAVIATRKMIREDLDTSLNDIRGTAHNIVGGAVNRLSDENSHDYEDACSHDDSPTTEVDIETDHQEIEGYGKYKKVKRKCYSTDVTIATSDFSFSDDGKGNETGTLNAVFATERTTGELYSKYGRYIELSVRNREQTKKDKGEIDTVRLNVGGYMVYRTSAKAFLSSYITFGASQSSYDLTTSGVKSTGSFMAFNAGTGIGLTGEMTTGYLKFAPNIALDLIATGHPTFKGEFKINNKTYKRDIDQSILHKVSLSFEPKFHLYSSKRFAEAGSVTTIAPSIFCASGSLETECGYSILAQNVTRNVMGTDLTTKLGYSAIGDVTTTSLSLNANSYLFGNKFIRLKNEISAKQDKPKAATTSVSTDPYMSYKMYIEMLY